MTPDQQRQQQHAIRADQERFDRALAKIGERARAPVLGESRNDYRREQLREIKRRHLANHELYKVNMRGLPDGPALDNVEQMVCDAMVKDIGTRSMCRSARSRSARNSTISAGSKASISSAKNHL